MTDPILGTGCLLVASPELLDPNFLRTVVFVIGHDGDGTFGLVLNRPVKATLADVLDSPGEGATLVRMLRGGPVQPEMLQFLARGTGPGRAVLPGVAVGGDLDALLEHARAGSEVRAYAGYAGWGAGQLERETREGSWIVAPARAEHVFDVPSEKLWAQVLRGLGGRYAWMALDTGDPGSN